MKKAPRKPSPFKVDSILYAECKDDGIWIHAHGMFECLPRFINWIIKASAYIENNKRNK